MAQEEFISESSAYIDVDVFIDTSFPDTAFPASTLDLASNSGAGAKRRSLMQLLLPTQLKGDGVITKVELVLFATGGTVASGISKEIAFHKATDQQITNSTTYNTQPAFDATPFATFDAIIDASSTPVPVIDITDLWETLDWELHSAPVTIKFTDEIIDTVLLALSSKENGPAKVRVTFSASVPDRLTSFSATQPDLDTNDVLLDWSSYNPESDVSDYKVYRATSQFFDVAAATLITTVVGLNNRSHTDPGVAADTTYFYAIVPIDSDGNEFTDGLSTESIFVSAGDAPSKLTNLSVTQPDLDVNDVLLDWSSYTPETDVTKYEVYRATSQFFDAADATLITTVLGINNRSFTDPGVTVSTTFFYAIVPVDGDNNSFTEELDTTSIFVEDGDAPIRIASFSITQPDIDVASLLLDWGNYQPALDVADYRVYRSTANFYNISGPTLIATVIGRETTTHTDSTVVLGTTYYYAIVPIDTSGNTFDENLFTVSFTVSSGGPPAEISSLVVSQPDLDLIDVLLDWEGHIPSPDVVEYEIYRATTIFFRTADATLINTVAGINNITFTDTTAVAGTTYFYAVVPVDATGFFSDDVLAAKSITVGDPLTVSVISGDLQTVLSLDVKTSASITLKWTPVTSGLFDSFQIHRRDVGTTEFDLVVEDYGKITDDFSGTLAKWDTAGTPTIFGGKCEFDSGSDAIFLKFDSASGVTALCQDFWTSFRIERSVAATSGTILFLLRVDSISMTEFIKLRVFDDGSYELRTQIDGGGEVIRQSGIAGDTPAWDGGAVDRLVTLYIVGTKLTYQVVDLATSTVLGTLTLDEPTLTNASGTFLFGTSFNGTTTMDDFEFHSLDAGETAPFTDSALVVQGDISQTDPASDTFPTGRPFEYEIRVIGTDGSFFIPEEPIAAATSIPIQPVQILTTVPSFSAGHQIIVTWDTTPGVTPTEEDDFDRWEARYEEDSNSDPTISSTLGFTETDVNAKQNTITGLSVDSHYKIALFGIDNGGLFRISMEEQ